MLIAFNNWLRNNIKWNILLVATYYLLVVLPHNKIGQFLSKHLDLSLIHI